MNANELQGQNRNRNKYLEASFNDKTYIQGLAGELSVP